MQQIQNTAVLPEPKTAESQKEQIIRTILPEIRSAPHLGLSSPVKPDPKTAESQEEQIMQTILPEIHSAPHPGLSSPVKPDPKTAESQEEQIIQMILPEIHSASHPDLLSPLSILPEICSAPHPGWSSPVLLGGAQSITALYERLSRDDELEGESGSITHQKAFLTEYAEKNGFTNCRHYTDDGYSGGNFERPGWKQLIADIENGLVGTVIAKDLSRVGRNYIETGIYIEIYFRKKNVRFIAVGNGMDSNDPNSGELVPFANIVNEMLLRDQSRKMRACYHQKGTSGSPTNNLCVYGYRKDPENRNHWLVDPEAAEVVRRIFHLAGECHGPYEIAEMLSKDHVLCPACYNVLHDTCMKRANTDMSKPYHWNGATVTNILRRPEYMGYTVNFRTEKNGWKVKRTRKPPNEWLLFEDTHEAIVAPEEWIAAQNALKVRRRTDSTGSANPLTGKLFCAECGAMLNDHRSKAKRTGKASDDYYDCPTYSQGKGDCCCHYITTDFLRSILLSMIQQVSRYALTDEQAFTDRVRSLSTLRQREDAKAKKAEIQQIRKRIKELDVIIRKLYESYALEKIPENRYEALSAEYEKERSELKERLSKDESALIDYGSDAENAERFLTLARKYREIRELTPEILNGFIDKVLIHAPEKINGQRTVKIDVYFRFIGNFTVPQIEPLLTEDEKQKEARAAKKREYQHQYYLKRKAKHKKPEQ